MRPARQLSRLVSLVVTASAVNILTSPPAAASLAWDDDPCEENGGQVAVAPDKAVAPGTAHPMAYVACADGSLLYHGAGGKGTNERILGVLADDFVDVASTSTFGVYAVSEAGRVEAVGEALHHGDLYPTTGVVALEQTETGDGYWIVTRRGEVIGFGDAADLGPATDTIIDSPVVAFASDGDTGGWVVTATGQVVALNGAADHGSVEDRVATDDRVVGIVSDRSSGGFWVVTREGRILEAGGAAPEPEQALCQDSPGADPPFTGAVGDYHRDATAVLWIYSFRGGICGFNPGS